MPWKDNEPMAHVLQLTKILREPPSPSAAHGIAIRNFEGAHDITDWLGLRSRAFAREAMGVRAWTEADFQAELLDKPWWSSDRFWVAEISDAQARRFVGAVALAERAPGRPAVHWLMVEPTVRRRGIGRLLMEHLEAWCWNRSYRQIWLETHTAWHKAAQFYESLGYRPTREPSVP